MDNRDMIWLIKVSTPTNEEHLELMNREIDAATLLSRNNWNHLIRNLGNSKMALTGPNNFVKDVTEWWYDI